MKSFSEKEDAVSPVIGVMLLIVITVIIAAVVSGFATGFISTNSGAPTAFFDVKISSNTGSSGNEYVMTIEHLGGSVIDTSELRIVTSYSYDGLTDAGTGKWVLNRFQKTNTVTVASALKNNIRYPYLADVGIGNPGDAKVNFGNFDFKSGQIMTTGTSVGTTQVLGFDVTAAANGFKAGSVVDVKIIHTPSNIALFDKEVRVA